MKTTAEKKAHPASQRKLKNYLLYPEMQLKYAALYGGLIVLLALVIGYLQIMHNNQLAQQIPDTATMEGILDLQRRNLLVQLGAFVLAAIMLFLMTILITHRFVGPIVSIIRFLQTDPKERPLTLRSHDELKPLIDFLNSVDIKVTKKEP